MSEEPFNRETLGLHLASVVGKGQARSDKALMTLALRVENLAKQKVVEGGQHSPRTATTASPGSGPAQVSGQLRASIGHESVGAAGTLTIRVGTRDTARRPYSSAQNQRERGSLMGRRRKGGSVSTNATVGAALELRKKGPRYPFLKPAYDEGTKGLEDTFRASFAEGDWR